MSFVGAISSGFKNYVNFKGKASRAQYWYWVLFNLLLALVLGSIEGVIWPTAATTARRLHDAGFSAKWLFLFVVPAAYSIFATVGAIALINDYPSGQEFSPELLMSLVFLIVPILALAAIVFIIFLVLVLKTSKSFYDGNKYVEPEPLDSLDEGTTA
jgi:uncharacterized membrane protein YhaH (DUF805 family)